MKYKTKRKGNKAISRLRDFYKVDEDLLSKGAETFTLLHRLQYNNLVFQYSAYLTGYDGELFIYDEKARITFYKFENIEKINFYARIINTSLIQSIIEGNSEKAFILIFQFSNYDIFNNIFNLPENDRELFVSSGEISINPNQGLIYKRFKNRIDEEYIFTFKVSESLITLAADDFSKNKEGDIINGYKTFDLKVLKERKSVVFEMNKLFKR